MKQRKSTAIPVDNRLAVGIEDAAAMLGVGLNMAERIGREAGACFYLGKRKLYNIELLRAYLRKKGGKEDDAI